MTKKSPQSQEEKAAARAQRQAAKAQRELAEQQEQQRLAVKRQEQLSIAKAATEALERDLETARERQEVRSDLMDHASGFYQEIDKLARGKSLFEATHLVVEEANQIVKDAKAVIKGDTYLDRVKEFVPAGNNPTYPDVVITIKTILQALGRAESRFESTTKAIKKRLGEAFTIYEALLLYCNEPRTISKDDVSESIDEHWLHKEWFVGYAESFDFERLDDLNLAEYLATDIDA